MNRNIYKLPQNKSTHQVTKTGKVGVVALFLHESVKFNIRNNLSVNNADIAAVLWQ